jgi:HlyD family secretion protein
MRVKLSILLSIVIFYSCNNRVEKSKPVLENITESVYASGIIKSKNQYQVFSTVTGIVNKLLVTENDSVKTGTPLIQVSNETSKISRENALLAANYANVTANQEKLTELENSIAFAQSKYHNDSLIFKRQQNLWNQGIGSKLDLEQKELAAKNSKNAFESAKLKYTDLLKQLKFNAGQARNNLTITQKNESDFIVRSEIEGKVYSLYKQPGEIVNPQTPLALVGDSKNFLLELQVDEYDIAKIKEGQRVLVSMDSYKGKIFEARVSKIYPLMNEHSKSFSVEAVFVSSPPVLYPNLTVESNVSIQAKEKALLIPRSYLINDSLVLVAKDKMRVVSIGLKDYRNVEIIKGLDTNDVIYKPQQ